MLGHPTASMTLDLYGHLLPDQLDDWLQRPTRLGCGCSTMPACGIPCRDQDHRLPRPRCAAQPRRSQVSSSDPTPVTVMHVILVSDAGRRLVGLAGNLTGAVASQAAFPREPCTTSHVHAAWKSGRDEEFQTPTRLNHRGLARRSLDVLPALVQDGPDDALGTMSTATCLPLMRPDSRNAFSAAARGCTSPQSLSRTYWRASMSRRALATAPALRK